MSANAGDPGHERISWRYQVRVADLNPGGHLDNLHILRAADEARFQLLGMREPGGVVITPGALDRAPSTVTALVAAHHADYRRELWYAAEPVEVTAWVCRLGGSSFDVAFEIRAAPGAPVAAVVVTTVVLLDLAVGRPWPMDQAVRGALTAYLGEPPATRARG